MDQAPSPPAQAATPGAAAPSFGREPRFGELAPAFIAATDANPQFQSLSLGGQWVVLMFFSTLSQPRSREAMSQVLARRALFDDARALFFGVSTDPADRDQRGLKASLPGVRYFWDFDQAVSRLHGLVSETGFKPLVFLIDPGRRIAAAAPITHVERLLDQLEAELRAQESEYGAPVLTAPRVLEPAFCEALIELYERAGGGSESGFMREVNGLTVPVNDHGLKRRRDLHIPEDDPLHAGLRSRLASRLLPQIQNAFFWRATRIERYIVARYAADEQGFFAPHRDNTTSGTAHRRFAVTINLNDDFDGGELRFPEFGRRTYRPPLGGATVFSCTLLHEATPVTRGVRFATLPFLYDDAGAAIREANRHKLRPDLGERAGRA
jgi:peroxiredoxin/predicted 2-oxoglutarate/Fe(II)-dependent dioxygenase YbiX